MYQLHWTKNEAGARQFSAPFSTLHFGQKKVAFARFSYSCALCIRPKQIGRVCQQSLVNSSAEVLVASGKSPVRNAMDLRIGGDESDDIW